MGFQALDKHGDDLADLAGRLWPKVDAFVETIDVKYLDALHSFVKVNPP